MPLFPLKLLAFADFYYGPSNQVQMVLIQNRNLREEHNNKVTFILAPYYFTSRVELSSDTALVKFNYLRHRGTKTDVRTLQADCLHTKSLFTT